MSLPPSSTVVTGASFACTRRRPLNVTTTPPSQRHRFPGPWPYLLARLPFFRRGALLRNSTRDAIARGRAFSSERDRHERKGIKLVLYCSLCAPWGEPGGLVRLEFPRRVDSRRRRRPRRFLGDVSGEIYTGALPCTAIMDTTIIQRFVSRRVALYLHENVNLRAVSLRENREFDATSINQRVNGGTMSDLDQRSCEILAENPACDKRL